MAFIQNRQSRNQSGAQMPVTLAVVVSMPVMADTSNASARYAIMKKR